MSATAYQLECLAQLKDWVNGICRRTSGRYYAPECCPDFSCCHPDMFEQDRARRVARYNNYAVAIGEPLMLDS